MMIQLSLHRYLFCVMGSYTRIFDRDGKLAYNELEYEDGANDTGERDPYPYPILICPAFGSNPSLALLNLNVYKKQNK